MDSREFLGVVQTHDPNRWEIEVVPRLQTHGGFLWGGAGLASSVYAMEQMSGRQLVWATAQFLSHARPPEVMSIDVDLSVVGRTVTQARTVGHVAHKEILTVNAALGERNFAHSGQFVTMPEVPRPESITPWPPDRDNKNTISDRLDLRFVKGRRMTDRNGVMDDGRTIMWAKVRDVVTGVDSASLAVLADFVPMGLGMNMGINGGGTSIDNTIRIYKLAPTEWVCSFREDVLDAGGSRSELQSALAISTEAELKFPKMLPEFPGIKPVPCISRICGMRFRAMGRNDAGRWCIRMNDVVHGSGLLASQFSEGFVFADRHIHQCQLGVSLAPFAFQSGTKFKSARLVMFVISDELLVFAQPVHGVIWRIGMAAHDCLKRYGACMSIGIALGHAGFPFA